MQLLSLASILRSILSNCERHFLREEEEREKRSKEEKKKKRGKHVGESDYDDGDSTATIGLMKIRFIPTDVKLKRLSELPLPKAIIKNQLEPFARIVS